MINAALELVHVTYLVGLPALPAVRLLEEILARLGADDSHLKARALGGLARIMGFTEEQEKHRTYAQEAVAMARRFDDPELLSYSLLGMFFTLMGPDHAEQRLGIATEMLDLARSENSIERMVDGLFWRAFCLFELGEVGSADVEIEAWARWRKKRITLHLSLVSTVRACAP